MYTHLLCLINTLYNNNRVVDLIKSQRCGYMQGFYTLSDIIINDDHFDKLKYPITDYDLLYKDTVCWNSVYMPTLIDQTIIYTLSREHFKRGPLPRWITPYNIPIQAMDKVSATPYVKACVAAIGALRALYGWSTLEIDLLCEDILLLIGNRLRRELVKLPDDGSDSVQALRKSIILRKLNKG